MGLFGYSLKDFEKSKIEMQAVIRALKTFTNDEVIKDSLDKVWALLGRTAAPTRLQSRQMKLLDQYIFRYIEVIRNDIKKGYDVSFQVHVEFLEDLIKQREDGKLQGTPKELTDLEMCIILDSKIQQDIAQIVKLEASLTELAAQFNKAAPLSREHLNLKYDDVMDEIESLNERIKINQDELRLNKKFIHYTKIRDEAIKASTLSIATAKQVEQLDLDYTVTIRQRNTRVQRGMEIYKNLGSRARVESPSAATPATRISLSEYVSTINAAQKVAETPTPQPFTMPVTETPTPIVDTPTTSTETVEVVEDKNDLIPN